MASGRRFKILHLTTHLNIGGITSYLSIIGGGLLKIGHEISVGSGQGELSRDLQRKGIRVFFLPFRTKSELSPKLYFAALPKLVRLLKEEKFDLIHAHTRVTQVVAALASRITGVPVVTTAHGYYKPRFGRRLFGCWGKRVIAISSLVGEELKKSHVVPEYKIRVVENAIDTEAFEKKMAEKNPLKIRRGWNIPDQAVVVGSVSRLVRDKGHEFLIEAVRLLRERGRDVFLLVLGDGRERKNLENRINQAGLQENSRMITGSRDVTEVFAAIDIFAHPATFREGFGLSLMEAMLAGKPVVATDIWAVNSIIRDKTDGFLVPPKNAAALADQIDFLVANPAVSKTVAEEGRRMASRRCSLDRMVDQIEGVYAEAVN
jgi:glycosyltransferase involved in cell wall biosynthesis